MDGYYGAQVQIRPGVTVEGGSVGYNPSSGWRSRYDRSDGKRNCIRVGAEGEDATTLGWALARAGYLSERDYFDAQDAFTPAMQSALIAFQRANGLSADGIAGPNTWAKLGDVGVACGSSSSSRSSSSTRSSSSSSSSSSGSSTTPTAVSRSGSLPFYQQTWFYWTVGGVTMAAVAALILLPKKKRKK